MECQNLFYFRKNKKKKIPNLSSTELAQRVVKVKLCQTTQRAVGSTPNRRFRGHKFESQLSHIIFFVGTDHETISKASLPLPLIQERQMSVTDERMCTNTGSTA